MNENKNSWVPNSKAKECHDCAKDFGFFQRRHHCRICYFVFCQNCTIKTNISVLHTSLSRGGKSIKGVN